MSALAPDGTAQGLIALRPMAEQLGATTPPWRMADAGDKGKGKDQGKRKTVTGETHDWQAQGQEQGQEQEQDWQGHEQGQEQAHDWDWQGQEQAQEQGLQAGFVDTDIGAPTQPAHPPPGRKRARIAVETATTTTTTTTPTTLRVALAGEHIPDMLEVTLDPVVWEAARDLLDNATLDAYQQVPGHYWRVGLTNEMPLYQQDKDIVIYNTVQGWVVASDIAEDTSTTFFAWGPSSHVAYPHVLHVPMHSGAPDAFITVTPWMDD